MYCTAIQWQNVWWPQEYFLWIMYIFWLHQTSTSGSHWGSLQSSVKWWEGELAPPSLEPRFSARKGVEFPFQVIELLSQMETFIGVSFTSERRVEWENDRWIGVDWQRCRCFTNLPW